MKHKFTAIIAIIILILCIPLDTTANTGMDRVEIQQTEVDVSTKAARLSPATSSTTPKQTAMVRLLQPSLDLSEKKVATL